MGPSGPVSASRSNAVVPRADGIRVVRGASIDAPGRSSGRSRGTGIRGAAERAQAGAAFGGFHTPSQAARAGSPAGSCVHTPVSCTLMRAANPGADCLCSRRRAFDPSVRGSGGCDRRTCPARLRVRRSPASPRVSMRVASSGVRSIMRADVAHSPLQSGRRTAPRRRTPSPSNRRRPPCRRASSRWRRDRA